MSYVFPIQCAAAMNVAVGYFSDPEGLHGLSSLLGEGHSLLRLHFFLKYGCGLIIVSIWPLYADFGSIVSGQILYHAKEECPSKKSFIEYVAEVLDLSYFVFLFNMALVLLTFYFLEVMQLVFAWCFYAIYITFSFGKLDLYEPCAGRNCSTWGSESCFELL